jgi:hypothetical protein
MGFGGAAFSRMNRPPVSRAMDKLSLSSSPSWTMDSGRRSAPMFTCRGVWGFVAVISRAFCGRSENDITNRWYPHLQPALTASIEVHKERKKRIRTPVDAKVNATRLIVQTNRGDRPE